MIMKKLVKNIPSRYIRNKIMGFPSQESIVLKITELKKRYKEKIIIFPSPGTPWGYLFQRPQQLAEEFARRGYAVIYMVDKNFYGEPDWSVRGFFELSPNLYLFDDGCDGRIVIDQMKEHKNLKILNYWPKHWEFTRNFKNGAMKIIDCIDHVSNFGEDQNTKNQYECLLEDADIVISTAENIKKELDRVYNIQSELISNGVRLEDFKTSTEKFELQIEGKDYDKIIGYYGAIASWFDFEMIEYAAKKNTKKAFVFAGQVYDDVKSRFNKLIKENENIFFLGRIKYSKIPSFLQCFDIAIIPFKINDITINTNPVKIYEYMAGHKIVITTMLPEVENIPGIFKVADKHEFECSINMQLGDRAISSIFERYDKYLEEYTWGKKVELIESLIERQESNKL